MVHVLGHAKKATVTKVPERLVSSGQGLRPSKEKKAPTAQKIFDSTRESDGERQLVGYSKSGCRDATIHQNIARYRSTQ